MEVVCIIDILGLSWVKLLLKCSEIIFAELRSVLGFECFPSWVLITSLVLVIDSLSGSLSETLTVEIFTCYLGDVAGITGDVLSLYVGSWSTDPVLTLAGVVSELKSLGFEVLGWWVHLIVVLFVIWF